MKVKDGNLKEISSTHSSFSLNKLKKYFIVSTLLIAISSVSYADEVTESKLTEEPFSSVYIYRNQFVRSARINVIAIGGDNIARIVSDSYITLKLKPGSYDISLPYDNFKVTIAVTKGEDTYLWNHATFFGSSLVKVDKQIGENDLSKLKRIYEVFLTVPLTYKYPDGSMWQGETTLGEPKGSGKATYSNGNFYEGAFLKGKPNGEGVYYQTNGALAGGFFKDGLLNGEGYIKTQNGHEYTGNLRNHKPHGSGELLTEKGLIVGKFNNGKLIVDNPNLLNGNTNQSSLLTEVANFSLSLLKAVAIVYANNGKNPSSYQHNDLLNDTSVSTMGGNKNSFKSPKKTNFDLNIKSVESLQKTFEARDEYDPSLDGEYQRKDSGYKSRFGNKYEYDLSKPSDQIRYEVDPDAQRRDSMDIDPMRSIERDLGEFGGGKLR